MRVEIYYLYSSKQVNVHPSNLYSSVEGDVNSICVFTCSRFISFFSAKKNKMTAGLET
jgi:hypothetical protein